MRVQTCHFSSKTKGSLAPLKSLSLFGLRPLTLLPSKVMIHLSSFSIPFTLFILFFSFTTSLAHEFSLPQLFCHMYTYIPTKVFKKRSKSQHQASCGFHDHILKGSPPQFKTLIHIYKNKQTNQLAFFFLWETWKLVSFSLELLFVLLRCLIFFSFLGYDWILTW